MPTVGEHSSPAPPAPELLGPGGSLGTFRLIATRNFGPYFFGNLVSNCGMWFQNFAVNILVFRLTHSVFMLGVVNFAQFAGVVLLAPWSGRAADRFDRRRVVLATQSGAIAVAGLLTLSSGLGIANTALVVGLALAGGATLAFSAPALNALVPMLVERRQLPAAVALNSATFNLGRVLGPVLAALVIDRLGVTWSFGFATILYLGLVAALLIVNPRRQERRPAGSLRLRDSIAEVRRTPRLAIPLLIVAVVAVSADPVTTLGPAFATHAFHRSDTLAGFFVGAFGAGAVAAAFTIGAHPGRTLARASATLGLLGLGVAGFALAPGPGAALALLLVAGFGFLGTNAAATTRLQMEVDERQRGRVMALWSVAFLGVRPLGSLVDGAIASATNIHVAALSMAAPALLLAGGLLVVYRPARPWTGAALAGLPDRRDRLDLDQELRRDEP